MAKYKVVKDAEWKDYRWKAGDKIATGDVPEAVITALLRQKVIQSAGKVEEPEVAAEDTPATVADTPARENAPEAKKPKAKKTRGKST